MLPTFRELMAIREFIVSDLPEADLSLTWLFSIKFRVASLGPGANVFHMPGDILI